MTAEVPTSEEFNDLESTVLGLSQQVVELGTLTDTIAATVGGLETVVDTTAAAVTGIGGEIGSLWLEVVQTNSAVTSLGARVTALEGSGGPSVPVSGPKTYRPENYPGASTGDWTTAFQAMFDDLEDHLHTDAGGSVPVCDGVIQLDARSYTLSEGFMGLRSGRAEGLTIRGQGRRTTEIVYTGSGHLFENHDRWMGVRFSDLSFRGSGSGTMLYSWSSNAGANQDWNFTNVEWRGAWANGIVLDGPDPANTNSEWVFDRCTVTGAYAGAFLWSGATATVASQDQFLNFWFDRCKIEFSGGTFLRFDRGGSISIRDSSLILTGTNQRFFYMPLPPSAHADSVQNLIVDGCRIEPRDVSNIIGDMTWKGQVSVLGCMDNAWSYRSGNESQIMWHFTNPAGVSFERCQLAGKHQYTQSAAPSVQKIRYVSCQRGDVANRNATFYVKDGAQAANCKIVLTDDRDGLTGVL